ncbi:hypothetical protein [Nocardioides sp.]|uniref:hypothetical protein n=1 Tax=Nocardioides sp. TaxID=35761 RepID=UPI003519B3CA
MSRLRPSVTTRLGLAVLTLSSLTAVGGALTSSAQAATASATVPFTDCELREEPFGANTRIKDNIAWSPTMTFTMPTPIAAGTTVTAELTIGALPAGLIPIDLATDTTLYPEVELVDAGGLNLLLGQTITIGSLDGSAAQPIGEIENDVSLGFADIYDYGVSTAEVFVSGRDSGGDLREYKFICDRIVNPPTLLSVAVYDLTATPEVTVDRGSARQGASVRVSGRHLLAAAPTEPPARATISVGGIVAGTLPIDQSGAFAGNVVVPAFAPPGSSVVVRAANGPKAATTRIQVTAAPATVAAPPSAKAGRKVTVTGARFKPGERVALVLTGGRGTGTKRFTAAATASATGTVRVAVKLRKAAKGAWRVTAVGAASKRSGTDRFRVR